MAETEGTLNLTYTTADLARLPSVDQRAYNLSLASDNTIMTDKGPFMSVPNETVCESPSVLPNVDSPENMEYLGQSVSHRVYWNKTPPSFGLLCGSSVSLCASRLSPTILTLHDHGQR
jgi:hypothetical protein